MGNGESGEILALLGEAVEGIREYSAGRMSPEVTDRAFSLTVSQARLFRKVLLLEESGGRGVSLKTLAEALNISPAAASEAVEILVGKKVLCRKRSRQDRRSVEIAVSEESKKFLELRRLGNEGVVAEGMAEFTPEERKAFLALLRKFTGALARAGVISRGKIPPETVS